MAHKGWTTRTIYVGDVAQALFTSPEGEEFVRATSRERPDLTLRIGGGLPPLKLRRFKASSARRTIREVERSIKRAAKKARRTRGK